MIQDIGPYTFHNEYTPVPPAPESYALYYEGGNAFMRKDGEEIEFLRFRDLEEFYPEFYEDYTYLFSIDGENYYLLDRIDKTLFPEFSLENKEVFRTTVPQHKSFAGITGYHLYCWYGSNHFCGKCGGSMEKSDKERMLFCKKCHHMVYPKLSPAVIIGVIDGDRILMTKYANRVYKKYALVAGYAEIGETLETTVAREVMEEVGLKVKNIRYYKSQPWAFSESLLMGFYCDLDGEDAVTLDENELALGEWFSREEIPVVDNYISLTNEMIMRFKNGLE